MQPRLSGGPDGGDEMERDQVERDVAEAPDLDGEPDVPEGGAGPADHGDADDPEVPHTALPPKMEAWRKRSAAGAILTGFALGLQQALETHREEPSIVVQTTGDLPDDLAVEADFEYGRPRQSVVSIRPWLLNDSADKRADRDADTAGGGDPAQDS